MIRRCHKSTAKDFGFYGGRGIQVADEWHDFKSFQHDMLPRYKKGLTLERIDNSKGYSRLNCRWANHKEQCNNRRSNHIIKDPQSGRRYTVQQLSEVFGVKYQTIQSRLRRGNSRFDQLIERSHLRTYNHNNPFTRQIEAVRD